MIKDNVINHLNKIKKHLNLQNSLISSNQKTNKFHFQWVKDKDLLVFPVRNGIVENCPYLVENLPEEELIELKKHLLEVDLL